MKIVLAVSIACLALAALGSLGVVRRSRDPRVWLIFGLLFLFGAAEGLALWLAWDVPLGLDPATAAAFTALAASILAVWVVVSIGRTLRELDQAEAIHWRSMEAVRALSELAGDPRLTPEMRAAQMLEIGCRCFGLDIGIRSRVSGERYEVAAIRAPDGFPIRPGAAFPLSETWCRRAVSSPRPIEVARLEDVGPDAHPGRSAFPFAAYLGIALRRGDHVVGTLAFASSEPRGTRFTASEKDVLMLMARWLESAAESGESGAIRALAAPAAQREPEPVVPAPERAFSPLSARSPQSPQSPGWETRPIPAAGASAGPSARSIDLNAVLRRLQPRLERATRPRVGLSFELDPQLAAARDPRLPVDTLVTSLVRHVAAAMGDGGEITLSTANLDLAGGESGVLPAVAPDRYVTLRLRDTAAHLDGDALARLFDASNEAPGGPLSFARIYRMLQGCGGDLSVEVEPGRGSTWTVFLPCAVERPDAPEPPARHVLASA